MGYASFTCPKCGAEQDPCLHTYRSDCGGCVTDDMYCEDCGMQITEFICDECGCTPDEEDCIDVEDEDADSDEADSSDE